MYISQITSMYPSFYKEQNLKKTIFQVGIFGPSVPPSNKFAWRYNFNIGQPAYTVQELHSIQMGKRRAKLLEGGSLRSKKAFFPKNNTISVFVCFWSFISE